MSGELTREEAILWLLGRECHACGAALPGPGEPCDACGSFPAVTAPELAAELDGPRALAAVHAAKIRAEAGELRSRMLAKYTEADRVEHMARLQERLALAQSALDSATAACAPLEAPLKTARKAEAHAARDLASAAEDHAGIARAEETARRMRHGLNAEAEAARLLAEADEVLGRYQAELADKAAARQAAENALASARHLVAQCEQRRDEAAADLAGPGRIPLSGETVAADPVRLLLTGQLDETEILMAQLPARFLAAMTGLEEDIEASARRELKEEQAREWRDRPLRTRADSRGDVTAFANPARPALPAQASPPGPGTGNGFSPPLIPGLSA